MVGAKADAEREMRDRRREIIAIEQKLEAREETFEKRQEAFERREADLNRRDQSLRSREKNFTDKEELLQKQIDEARTRLEAVAGLTRDEAKRSLMDEMIGQARTDAAKHIRIVEEEAREEADRRAKRVVAIAIERLAGEFVAERTVSVLALPNDEMKGRIIGREGRNIRAIEAATGVDIIIDDTPEAVVISCHNPIRREIARVALQQLISDGRIHPGRIEEVVNKARTEVDAAIVETGEQAAYETGVRGLHPELIKLIGRMRWRTSYGQNILQHSKEVAWLAGIMAAELGLDVALAKRGALLHDVGKVLTHEHEGTHVQLGVEVATKYGESPLVVNCIAAHHDDVPHETEVSVLVQAADAISGSRPGARREAFETYVKRLEGIERIASSYRGVDKVFAIQAGREVRVVVTPEDVDDARMTTLSEEIARRIEAELQYPGQIKVVVIRETRAVDFAR